MTLRDGKALGMALVKRGLCGHAMCLCAPDAKGMTTKLTEGSAERGCAVVSTTSTDGTSSVVLVSLPGA